MPGGDQESYKHLEPILKKIAAKTPDDGPCVAYLGSKGSGHFVKMVHNGIEYGDMQLIAEAYDLLKNVAGLNNAQLKDVFTEWNGGELKSFLIEITAKVIDFPDPDDSRPLSGRHDSRQGRPEGDRQVDDASRAGPGRPDSDDHRRRGCARNLRAEGRTCQGIKRARRPQAHADEGRHQGVHQ